MEPAGTIRILEKCVVKINLDILTFMEIITINIIKL